jgi:cytochrome c oxidase subunit 7c
MLSRAATRTASQVARRGFHTTRPRMSSPYHYPEGPYSNLPFNPRSKWFGAGYWSFMATGFFLPFGIAGEFAIAVFGGRAASWAACPAKAARSFLPREKG